jgi:Carbohydrate family 9 binding domain-like
MTPKSYAAYRTCPPPKIDGKYSFAEWGMASWTDLFQDIEGDKKPAPEYRTRVKMLWDESHLYILAEMEEPHLWATLKNHDDIIYRDNDFEIFLDPDGDTLEYFEIEINGFGTILDLYLNKPYRKGGRAELGWNATNLQTAVGIMGTLNNNSDVDEGWIVEMAIPFEALNTKTKTYRPTTGDTWRINFSRVQWELEKIETGYRKKKDASGRNLAEKNWVWSPQGIIDMHLPEKWGYLKLID